MHPGIIFAVVAAIAFGIWTVSHSLAANHIHNLLGAIVISLTAVIVGTILIIPNLKETTLITNGKGIIFAVLAGIMALAIDYFVLKAYGSGLAISITGPIVIGGSIAVATLIGFFMGETLSVVKIIGLTLVIVGASLLAATAK